MLSNLRVGSRGSEAGHSSTEHCILLKEESCTQAQSTPGRGATEVPEAETLGWGGGVPLPRESRGPAHVGWLGPGCPAFLQPRQHSRCGAGRGLRACAMSSAPAHLPPRRPSVSGRRARHVTGCQYTTWKPRPGLLGSLPRPCALAGTHRRLGRRGAFLRDYRAELARTRAGAFHSLPSPQPQRWLNHEAGPATGA